MAKKTSGSRFSIVSNFVRFIPLLAIAAFACAWEDETSYTDLCGPDLLSDTSYKNFIYPIPAVVDQLKAGIVREWQKRYPALPEATLEQVLFSTPLPEFEADAPSGPLAKLSKQDRDYLLIAKRCEAVANVEWSWEWSGRSDDEKADIGQFANEIVELAEKETDPFLKQRYGFQALRLHHFADEFSAVVNDWSGLGLDRMDTSLTYWRTLALVAGAMRKKGDWVTAKALFAGIFARCAEIRLLAYRNCKYIDSADAYDRAMKKAKTAEEQAALLFIQIVYEDGVSPALLSALYEKDGASPRFEVAALKQMNNLNDRVYNPWLRTALNADTQSVAWGNEDFWPNRGANAAVSSASGSWLSRLWRAIVRFFLGIFQGKTRVITPATGVGADLVAFPQIKCDWKQDADVRHPDKAPETVEFEALFRKAAAASAKNAVLFKCLAGYVALMRGAWEQAEKDFAQVMKERKPGDPIYRQAQFMSLLLHIERGGELSSSFEEQLENFFKTDTTGDEKAENKQRLLCNEFGRRLIQAGKAGPAAAAFILGGHSDAGKAILDFYLSPAGIDSLVTLRKSSRAPAFTRRLLAALPQDETLEELAGTKFLRMYELDSALTRFSRCGESWWKTSAGESPIITGENTGVQYDSGLVSISKPALCKRLKTLSADKTAGDAMKRGNLLYHSCFWAYTYTLWEGSLIGPLQYLHAGYYPLNVSPDFCTGFENRMVVFKSLYTTQYMAAREYRQAELLANNPEQKAQAIFSAKAAVETNYTSYSPQEIILKGTPLFERLKQSYAKTSFVGSARMRCTYLNDFLN